VFRRKKYIKSHTVKNTIKVFKKLGNWKHFNSVKDEQKNIGKQVFPIVQI